MKLDLIFALFTLASATDGSIPPSIQEIISLGTNQKFFNAIQSTTPVELQTLRNNRMSDELKLKKWLKAPQNMRGVAYAGIFLPYVEKILASVLNSDILIEQMIADLSNPASWPYRIISPETAIDISDLLRTSLPADHLVKRADENDAEKIAAMEEGRRAAEAPEVATEPAVPPILSWKSHNAVLFQALSPGVNLTTPIKSLKQLGQNAVANLSVIKVLVPYILLRMLVANGLTIALIFIAHVRVTLIYSTFPETITTCTCGPFKGYLPSSYR